MRISDWSSDVCSSDLVSRFVWAPPSIPQARSANETSTRLSPCFHAQSEQFRSLFDRVGDRRALAPLSGSCSSSQADLTASSPKMNRQIGRASCRERVCQYV